jgi:two-component system sensor histidine kinase KdpD
VLVNVLENAAKYSPENSRIEVLVQTVDSEASIMISDRGMGIPADDMERVFDKFYRVQRPESVTGTGLGLTISKGIIEIHKGHISAMRVAGSRSSPSICHWINRCLT